MSRVAVRVFQPLLYFAAQQGLDAVDLLQQIGFRTIHLDAEQRLPESVAAQLCQVLVARSKDPLFSLKAGLSASPESLGSLAYVLRNAPTVRAAFSQLQRFWHVLHDEPLFHLIEQGSGASVAIRADPYEAVQPRQALMEYLVAFMLRLSGSLLAGHPSEGGVLKSVDFRFVQPQTVTAFQYARLLRCERVCFAQPKTALHFEASVLSRRLPFADANLFKLFQQQLQMAPAASGMDIVAELRGLLRARFPGHLPSLPELAAELATSRASLQRRLAEAGSSYREIVQQLKRDTAIRLLKDNQHSLAEIAFMLDFSDTPSFHHAYKRWTGETPSATRSLRSG